MSRWVLILLAGLGLTGGCNVLDPDLDGLGTVRFVEVEGGCWGIETAEEFLEPTNLPAEFRVDGLRVIFEADGTDFASTCQIGPIVRLRDIRRADP